MELAAVKDGGSASHHGLLDSGSFFGYLYGISRLDSVLPPASGHASSSSGPEVSVFASRLRGIRGKTLDPSSAQADAVDATASTSSGHVFASGELPDATHSGLLSRVLRKRQRSSPAAAEDTRMTQEPAEQRESQQNCASTEEKACSPSNSIVVHEFGIPLSPPEGPPAKRPKGSGRGRCGRGSGRGRGATVDEHNGSVPRLLPAGWRPVPLADVLFQIGIVHLGSDDLAGGTGSQWWDEVRSRTGQTLVGIAAIREALWYVGLNELYPHVVDASWPPGCEDWKAIPLSRAAWEMPSGEDSSSYGGSYCSCAFRTKPIVASGGDSSCTSYPAEMLWVQLRLNVTAVMQSLLRIPKHEPGVRALARQLDYRIVPARPPRRRKQRPPAARTLSLLNNRDDPPAEQPPHFQRWPLRKEQLRSLRWMQLREQEADLFELTLSQGQVDPIRCSKDLAQASLDGAADSLGWLYELRCREEYIVRGGILGDALGYGKTATTIGLVDSQHGCVDLPPIRDGEAPYFFESKATLVLVPSNLLDQWVSEISKFLGDGSSGLKGHLPLRVLPIRTVSQLKAMTVRQLCGGADIVLCSYRLLYSPVYRRRLLQLAGEFAALDAPDRIVEKMPVNVQCLRSNTRRFRANPREVGWKHHVESPGALTADDRRSQAGSGLDDVLEDPFALRFPVLEQFWWRRIVFDEFHELEAMGNTAQFESLRNLCSHYRWGLTGTPPTRDLSQVSTLARLFQIGHLPQTDGVEEQDELAHNMAQHFLDHFARQNTSEEILPIQLSEHIVDVHQTPEERAIYLQASHDATASSSAGATPDRTEQLLKLCSHFAYGADAAADAGTECRRILALKRKRADRAAKQVLVAAATAELVWRGRSSLVGLSDGHSSQQREQLLERLRRRYNVHVGGARSTEVDPGKTGDMDPGQKTGEAEDAEASPAAPLAEAEAQQVYNGKPVAACAAYLAAVEALREVQRLSSLELRQRSSAHAESALVDGEQEAGPPSASQLELGASGEPLNDAGTKLMQAVEAFDVASRSQQFFERTLAATRGEASAEQRACSICLDDDIPCEQLSITACAHVFHTGCLKDVVAQFGSCPVCRTRLDAGKDVTCLSAELAAADKAATNPARPGKGGSGGGRGQSAKGRKADFAALASKFGSKLAAMAERLQEISRKGEKAIVFCQWEDLKRKIAEALSAFGIQHFQLSGNIYQRGDVIRRFQGESGENATPVLLLSLEHSASGTNLTAASHVVFVHPMNASSAERAVSYEAQAIGRCRRWGQLRPEVHCWRFVVRGTVEEAITAEHRRELWEHHLKQCSTRPPSDG